MSVAKPPSPLVGFNNNVKHLGRIFHVQTEDSGVGRPHIITHLFVDGGRIVKSTRTDYSEHVGRADMSTVVRRMMKEQHKAMFIALRDGQLNDAIDSVLGPGASEGAPVSAVVDVPPAPAPAPAPGRRRSRPPPSLPDMPVADALKLTLDPPPRIEHAPASASVPIPRKPSPTLSDLMLKDLEGARMRGGSPAEGEAPLSAMGGKPAPKGATPILGTPAVPPRPSTGPKQPSGRYAASRPAAIFSQSPEQNSLFGGSTISEQSLDEVILSYLAEDLDGSPDK